MISESLNGEWSAFYFLRSSGLIFECLPRVYASIQWRRRRRRAVVSQRVITLLINLHERHLSAPRAELQT